MAVKALATLLCAWPAAASPQSPSSDVNDAVLFDADETLGLLQMRAASGEGLASDTYQTYPYSSWSDPIKVGTCSQDSTPMSIDMKAESGDSSGVLTCSLEAGVKTYRFPAGIFEIGEQLLIPDSTAIIGANNPNDMSEPTKTPNWQEQTLFLATRGATDYLMNYCHAANMVITRVGFVLSSFVTVRNVAYQGVDTIRPEDNGALCGGGVFETKGCAENDCSVSSVNNGGSDGIGSAYVTIENVRLNDYYSAEDKALVGAYIEGNYDCKTTDFRGGECCFCKPNGVRSSQIGVWVPATRNSEGTQHILVNNIVASSTQADGINFHGKVDHAEARNAYFQNAGDDIYALWGAESNPTNVVFRDSVAVNPGILRPNWYGNCVATYGLQSVVFANLTCKIPTLEHPIPSPADGAITIDTSMFVFYNSFGASYPEGNSIKIEGWTFEDLDGKTYTASEGTTGSPEAGKMVWTKSETGVVAPYYVNGVKAKINVYASQ